MGGPLAALRGQGRGGGKPARRPPHRLPRDVPGVAATAARSRVEPGRRRKKGRPVAMRTGRAVLTSLGLLVLGAASVAAQTLEIHHINVGWGSSVFLKGPNGTTVLLEAGDTGKGAARGVPHPPALRGPPPAALNQTTAV